MNIIDRLSAHLSSAFYLNQIEPLDMESEQVVKMESDTSKDDTRET